MTPGRELRTGWRAWLYRGEHRSGASIGWTGSGDILIQAPHQR